SIDENGYYGIIPYIAPEIFQGRKSNKYTKASDIYSFGMIMWEIMAGRRPFWNFQDSDTYLIIQICDEVIIEFIGKIILNEKNNQTKIINSPDIGPVSKVTSISVESTRSLRSQSIFGKRKSVDSDNEENTKKVKFNENNCNKSDQDYISKELDFDI
ncbi:121_t:CDS:2, partial [Funneliformis geosporum]